VAALDLTVQKLERRNVAGVTTLFKASDGQLRDPRGFEALFPGPGHTSDNIVIAFPDRDVVFGGCLVKSADAVDLGFTGDADLAAWPDSIRRLAKRYPTMKVVPGHGPVAHGAAGYRRTLDLLTAAAAKKPPAAAAP